MVVARHVEVSLARISFGSIFRVLFVGLTCFSVPLALLIAAFALAGCPISTEDGEALQGASAVLFTVPFMLLGAVLYPLVFAVCLGIPLWLGLRLFAYARPWLGPLRLKALIKVPESHEKNRMQDAAGLATEDTAAPHHGRPAPPS